MLVSAAQLRYIDANLSSLGGIAKIHTSSRTCSWPATLQSLRYYCNIVDALQGDAEAQRQLPVTPMCDRNSVIVSTNQLRFIQYLLKVSLLHCTCGADVMLCCRCCAVLCYAMLCHATLCCAMLRYAALCYAALCYAMLRYAMLCCAMLCYAMLCYTA